MRALAILCLTLPLLAAPASAQQPAAEAPTPSFEELQATIARMQKQVEDMGQATAERDKALSFLTQQVDKATGQISGSGQANDSLRGQTATLSNELQGVSQERDRLAGEAKSKADALGDVQRQIAALEQSLGQERESRSGAQAELEQTRSQLTELQAGLDREHQERSAVEQSLGEERQGRSGAETELEQTRSRVTELQASLDKEHRERSSVEQSLGEERQGRSGVQAELEQTRSQLGALQASLDSERQERSSAAGELERSRAAAASLQSDLEQQKSATARELAAAREQVASLGQQLSQARDAATADAQRVQAELVTLRGENEALKGRLGEAASAGTQQAAKIADLDQKLQAAMAQKVEELSQYRSEFFGRLRQLLGDRPDVRIVGDRFVFQSELLFASGSATLDPRGTAGLTELAQSLREVAARIPADIDWVLRVDGHTDRLPLRSGPFTSNWELSSERAISVVEFLAQAGVPPQHLAAAGFAEFHPLDPRDDEIAYRRNRRIEFKLTEG